MPNQYTRTWYEVFLSTIAPSQTESEIAFLRRQLPRPQFQSIVDLCCGTGRHARHLAEAGYHVLGIDNNPCAIEVARRGRSENETYLLADMRHLNQVRGQYDAVVNLWQSFGYFDAETNLDVLCQIGDKLRPGGRLVLDIYHRSFFEQHQGERSIERGGRRIGIRNRLEGERLRVELLYDNGEKEEFEWQLFLPEEIEALGLRCGLRTIMACTSFDEEQPPTAEHARMQIVLERCG